MNQTTRCAEFERELIRECAKAQGQSLATVQAHLAPAARGRQAAREGRGSAC
jgi:hypothetical protein